MTKAKNIAIIVGAGKGRRIDNEDKIFLNLDKKPILAHAIFPFEKCNSIDDIILVVRKNKINLAKNIIHKYKFKKVKDIVSGGKERQDSVYNALHNIDKGDYVLIHDAARPLVKKQLIEDIIYAAKKYGAAIPAVPLKDTIKTGDKFVEKTLERDVLYLVHTPQAFEYKILKKAHEFAKKTEYYGTDDASLVERLGYRIKIIPSYFESIKITTQSDLVIAETLLKKTF